MNVTAEQHSILAVSASDRSIATLTLSLLNTLDVGSELVDCLNVFVLLNAVENNSTA